MFEYELFNVRDRKDYEKYYPIIKDWWEKKGGIWQAIQPELLSSQGIIVKNNNKYICAAWLYCTDSLYGVINWIITNNTKDGKIKRKAISFLLKKLEERAKELGIKLIYIPMETNSLKRVLEKESYVKTSDNISEFFKQII
jgi:hypothetical protein